MIWLYNGPSASLATTLPISLPLLEFSSIANFGGVSNTGGLSFSSSISMVTIAEQNKYNVFILSNYSSFIKKWNITFLTQKDVCKNCKLVFK